MNKWFLLAWVGMGLVAAGLVGCEVGSTNTIIPSSSVNFSGFYDSTGTNSAFVSPPNSGALVTSFNLRQTGNQLEAIDNNGTVFRGNVGDATTTGGQATAPFTLNGNTSAGQSVTISGTLGGSGTSATITGTWIEPNLYAYLSGDGVINPIQTNAPSGSITVTASPSSLSSNGQTATVTASGGNGSYTWTAGSSGSLSSTSGSSVTYTRTSSGNNTVTVTDTAAATGSATITQP